MCLHAATTCLLTGAHDVIRRWRVEVEVLAFYVENKGEYYGEAGPSIR